MLRMLTPSLYLLLCLTIEVGLAVAKSRATGPSRTSCNAAYNAPCSRVNSEWLSQSTSEKFAAADEATIKQLLDDITAGKYNMVQGFYPFVFDRLTSECVAHGFEDSFVGHTLDDIFETLSIGFSSSSELHQRFNDAANVNGDWVRYIWKADEEIGNKVAYVAGATDRYYIGVGFHDVPLPPDLPCSDQTDSWCSINNVMSLVGKAQSRLADAISLAQFETMLYEISFDTSEFEIEGGYYLYLYNFDSTLVAHARLQAFFGQRLPDVFVQLNRNYEDGVNLHQKIVRAALGENDGWVQYQWRNRADEPEYTKIAYIVEVSFGGEQYYLGCGFNFVMGDVFDGPLGAKCPPGYNLPCAFGTTMQLTSHAMAHAISSPLAIREIFEAVDYDDGFRRDDYYVFFTDYNGTCVAHGLAPHFVGLTMNEVFIRANVTTITGDFLHEQFVTAASNGGGFVLYDWVIPNVPNSDFQKISYVFEVTLEGRKYYGGVGFNHQRAPLQLELEYGTKMNGDPIPCSREYGSDCSEVNSQAILGQALADLVLASTETKVRPDSSNSNMTDVLSRISSGNDLYRANDFYVSVFASDQSFCHNVLADNSGCCIAHGGDASLVGLTWQEILDKDKITSIRGEDIHSQLAQQTDKGGVVLEYILADDTGSAKAVKAFSSRFRDNGNIFYVVAEYVDKKPPPTCDACPEDMECTEPDQAFCLLAHAKRPFYRSSLFGAIAIIVGMLPIVGLLFCWIGRRREKAQSEAQIRKIDEQMRKLRDQMEREQMTMAQTRKLVSSLFPEKVGDQILQQLAEEENRSSADKLTNFLNDENTSESSISRRMKRKDRAIAELFPSATIIFADIAGFTAWSSSREPAQVFQLLEGIYQHFDRLTKKRDVFKVETIGDCYVAVAGLPKKMDDHAVVMALFARDCLAAFNRLVQRMEVDLGPDTGDLRLRVGLHSGPVTAGVLKSDKARFQLFGDTVNTASRLESTGVPGKIQISHSTAELLKKAGKSKWFEARAERIVAKGKGEIQTYWLSTEAVNADLDGDEHFLKHQALGTQSADKGFRLVQWVTDGLGRLLKQIQGQQKAHRRGSIHRKSNTVHWSTPLGKTVLEEVREIIHMPSYNGEQAIDVDDVELDEKVVDQLEGYVSTIASMYRENAFHNFEHAAHVTMSVLKLMSRIVAPDLRDKMQHDGADEWRKHDHTYGITSDPLTQFACAFSALIHDVDHSGVPNTQVVKENPLLAYKYKGSSVAEQNSVDLAWGLLMSGEYNDLCFAICGGDNDNMTRFRQLVVNGVMSTDIMDAELKALRNMRWDKAFIQASDTNPKDASDRKATIVIDHIIQASDVAHTMQHWQVYRKWNERLFEEMLAAYLDGRSPKDPAEYWYKGELGFFDYYIIPLAKKLEDCGVFGVSSFEYLGYAEQNRQEWELRGKELVEKMNRDIRAKLTARPSGVLSI